MSTRRTKNLRRRRSQGPPHHRIVSHAPYVRAPLFPRYTRTPDTLLPPAARASVPRRPQARVVSGSRGTIVSQPLAPTIARTWPLPPTWLPAILLPRVSLPAEITVLPASLQPRRCNAPRDHRRERGKFRSKPNHPEEHTGLPGPSTRPP